MFRPGTYSLLLLCLLIPHLIWAQPDNNQLYQSKSVELYRFGRSLADEGKSAEALDTLKLALEYRIKAYPGDNSYSGRYYMALGITLKNLGRYEEALKNYKLAIECYNLGENVNPTVFANIYRNIGNVYRSKLDYINALYYFEQALSIYFSENNEFYINDTYYAIAEVKNRMNQDDKALEILLSHFDNSDIVNKIDYSELLGIIYQKKGEYANAENNYQKTIQLTKEYYGETDFMLAVKYLMYAEFLSEIKEFDKGIKVLDKAYSIISLYQNSKGIELADYFEYKGDLYRIRPIVTPNIQAFRQKRIANLNEALQWYDNSLNALYTGTGKAQIDNLTINNCLSFNECMILLKTIADTHYELAILYQEEKSTIYEQSLEDALAYYKVISQLIQRARQEISSDESKIHLAQLEYDTFLKTIKTAYLTYELENKYEYLELAFESSEQLKSSSVFDKISTSLAQENSLIPDSLLELETKLNSTVSFYNEKLFEENSRDEPDSSLIQQYNDKVFEANRQRDELNRTLEENYSDYYDLKYSKSTLEISEIQKELDKKEVILEYVLNESDTTKELYTILISHDKKEINRQELSDEMEHSMEYIFKFMTTPNYLFTRNEDSKEFCVASGNMYKLLIEPFSNVLINKNLIIIPDGKLNYIAFDGLLKSVPDTSQIIDFSKLDYLVRDFNVNYANSANILMKYRNSKRNMKNRILAFAPEYHSEKFDLSNATYTLSPLPGVQKEVDEISEIVKTEAYRGKEASEENFRKLSQNFDILHLAMHAYINDSLPAFSRLAFSPEKDEKDIMKDGWLNTADIYNLDLKNVRLTVLSACNTGVGKMQKGEGLMSLARGFLYAGCPSVVMSLWEVEDNAGTKIMASFYKNLKRGKTKDAALRAAKIEYLENANSRLAHPHYWMSFKCIGDNSPVYNSNDIYFFALLIVLILFFSIDQGIRIRKARRKRQAS